MQRDAGLLPKPIYSPEQLKSFATGGLQAELNRISEQQEPPAAKSCYKELQELFANPGLQEQLVANEQFRQLYTRSAEMIADTLVSEDKKIIDAMDSAELFLDPGKGPTPKYKALADPMSNLSKFIVADIVSRPPEERKLALEHWIRIADKCINHPQCPNYNIASAVYTGIADGEVAKLLLTNQDISPEAKAIVAKLNKMFGGPERPEYMDAIKKNPGIPVISGIKSLAINRNEIPLTKAEGIRADYYSYVKYSPLVEGLAVAKKIPFSASSPAVAQEVMSFVQSKEIDTAVREKAKTDATAEEATKKQRGTEKHELNAAALYTKAISAAPKPPSEQNRKLAEEQQKKAAGKNLLILDGSNFEKLEMIRELYPDCQFAVITDGMKDTDKIPKDIMQISSKDVQQRAEQIYAAKVKEFENDKIKLYTWYTFGKSFSSDEISSDAWKELGKKYEEFVANDYGNALDKLRKSIYENCIVGYAEEKYQANVYLFEQYTKDVVRNEDYHLQRIMIDGNTVIRNKEILDEPVTNKVRNALYVMLTNPAYFKPKEFKGLNDDALVFLKRGRIDFAKHYIDLLQKESPKEFDRLYKLLIAKRPKPYMPFIQRIPREIAVHIKAKKLKVNCNFEQEQRPTPGQLSEKLQRKVDSDVYRSTEQALASTAAKSDLEAQFKSTTYFYTGGGLDGYVEQAVQFERRINPVNDIVAVIAGRLVNEFIPESNGYFFAHRGDNVTDNNGTNVFSASVGYNNYSRVPANLAGIPGIEAMAAVNLFIGETELDASQFALGHEVIKQPSAPEESNQPPAPEESKQHLVKVGFTNALANLGKLDSHDYDRKIRTTPDSTPKLDAIGRYDLVKIKSLIDKSIDEAATLYNAKVLRDFAVHIGMKHPEEFADLKAEIKNYLLFKFYVRQKEVKKLAEQNKMSLVTSASGKFRGARLGNTLIDIDILIMENPSFYVNPDNYSFRMEEHHGPLGKTITTHNLKDLVFNKVFMKRFDILKIAIAKGKPEIIENMLYSKKFYDAFVRQHDGKAALQDAYQLSIINAADNVIARIRNVLPKQIPLENSFPKLSDAHKEIRAELDKLFYEIINEIISENDIDKRTLILQRYILMMEQCHSNKEALASYVIYHALNHKSIRDLKATFGGLTDEAKKILANFPRDGASKLMGESIKTYPSIYQNADYGNYLVSPQLDSMQLQIRLSEMLENPDTKPSRLLQDDANQQIVTSPSKKFAASAASRNKPERRATLAPLSATTVPSGRAQQSLHMTPTTAKQLAETAPPAPQEAPSKVLPATDEHLSSQSAAAQLLAEKPDKTPKRKATRQPAPEPEEIPLQEMHSAPPKVADQAKSKAAPEQRSSKALPARVPEAPLPESAAAQQLAGATYAPPPKPAVEISLQEINRAPPKTEDYPLKSMEKSVGQTLQDNAPLHARLRENYKSTLEQEAKNSQLSSIKVTGNIASAKETLKAALPFRTHQIIVDILSELDIKTRILMVERYIYLMNVAFAKGNYLEAAAIHNALQHKDVKSLQKTFSGISENARLLKADIELMIRKKFNSSDLNAGNVLELIKEMEEHPQERSTKADLTFFHEHAHKEDTEKNPPVPKIDYTAPLVALPPPPDESKDNIDELKGKLKPLLAELIPTPNKFTALDRIPDYIERLKRETQSFRESSQIYASLFASLNTLNANLATLSECMKSHNESIEKIANATTG